MHRIEPATESERTLLGAILLDNNVLRIIGDRICHLDFAHDFHQLLFKNMMMLFNKYQIIHVQTLVKQLKITDEDTAYIYRLIRECPSTANVKAHADIIREKSVKSQLASIKKNTSIFEKIIAEEMKLDEVDQEEYVPQKEMLASYLEEAASDLRSEHVDDEYLISLLVEITKAFAGSFKVMKHE